VEVLGVAEVSLGVGGADGVRMCIFVA